MVTICGVPEVPDDGDAAHPVIVQVKEGAPVSAVVTVMVTLTVAAWTGKDGKASSNANRPAAVRRTTPLPDSK
jgi:hypothetical protein